jgi:hypothetical protein
VSRVERFNHRTCVIAASPASFQPRTLAISAGRRSSGRPILRPVRVHPGRGSETAVAERADAFDRDPTIRRQSWSSRRTCAAPTPDGA